MVIGRLVLLCFELDTSLHVVGLVSVLVLGRVERLFQHLDQDSRVIWGLCWLEVGVESWTVCLDAWAFPCFFN